MDYPRTDKKLGFIYQPEATIFRLWSPIKNDVKLLIYKGGQSLQRKSYDMIKSNDGVHEVKVEGDLDGYYYSFLLDDSSEVSDPYSVASSSNSLRSAIVDLKKSNPKGWEEHKIPTEGNHTDAIIYELHIKDFTFDESSNVKLRGKFLGMSEKGTNYHGFTTALDHLIELGITHVHLMPIYDFLTVDEDSEFFEDDGNYNWGYDPELYNNVEGSYSTKPEDPYTRIRELKTMVMALHKAGIQVVMDVVYNHTYLGGESNFQAIMPGYYYRFTDDGHYSNGSGCGNELASENPMVQEFIVDSVKFWLDEYKIDGFRFDLMALTDKETMKRVVDNLRKDRPDILIYGEPWTGGSSTLAYDQMPVKGTQSDLGVAMFNDEFRDAIKGDNNGIKTGFSQGDTNFKRAVESGIAGSIDYDGYRIGFTQSPNQSINYINAHDDLILYDKMQHVFPSLPKERIVALNRLAFGILMTSQGIPFFHSGNEFLRSKDMIPNTYNAASSINNIDWTLKEKNQQFYQYFKDLIQLRKEHSVFRMTLAVEIREGLKFINHWSDALIAYTLRKENNDFLLIIHNSGHDPITVEKNFILDHLKLQYDLELESLNLLKIFDQRGKVDRESIEGNLIYVESIASEVYYLKV